MYDSLEEFDTEHPEILAQLTAELDISVAMVKLRIGERKTIRASIRGDDVVENDTDFIEARIENPAFLELNNLGGLLTILAKKPGETNITLHHPKARGYITVYCVIVGSE